MAGRELRAADVALLVPLVILGAALRFHAIGTGLWYDEIVTLVESVRAPLGEIVTRFAGDNHHPLYSVLAHLAVALVGEEPWALRLPAALFGVATIPLLYGLGRLVTSRVESGAAALILTVSYHHIWFSQNARGYTAVLFLVLLSTYALLRWLDERRPSFLGCSPSARRSGRTRTSRPCSLPSGRRRRLPSGGRQGTRPHGSGKPGRGPSWRSPAPRSSRCSCTHPCCSTSAR